jgi:hypothetical protein
MPPYSGTVLRDQGTVLHVPELMALAPLPLCWVFGESYALAPVPVTSELPSRRRPPSAGGKATIRLNPLRQAVVRR